MLVRIAGLHRHKEPCFPNPGVFLLLLKSPVDGGQRVEGLSNGPVLGAGEVGD